MAEKSTKPIEYDFDYIENVIIKHLLYNHVFYDVIIDHIKVDIFENKHNRRIVLLLLKFNKKFRRQPTKTELKICLSKDELKEAYAGVKNNINDIDDDTSAELLLEYAEQFIKIRSFGNCLINISENWESVKGANDLIPFYSTMEQIITQGFRDDKLFDYFEHVDKHIEQLDEKNNYISTGIEWLDNKLGGGYYDNDKGLYVFAGETNVGKSIFLHNTAVSMIKANKKVLLISLEMSIKKYAQRISSTLNKVVYNDLRYEKDILKKKIITFKNTHPGAELLIAEFPPNTMPVTFLRGFINKVIKQHFVPDAVVIDYANLLVGQGNNSYERVKDVAESLRALCYLYNGPLITATQLNRSGYSGAGSSSQSKMYDSSGPSLTSVSESYGLPATADGLFFIYRTDQDKEDSTIHLSMGKNRDGDNTGVTRLGVDYSYLQLYEDESLNQTDEYSDVDSSIDEYSVPD
jgi:replicative DNA helicase